MTGNMVEKKVEWNKRRRGSYDGGLTIPSSAHGHCLRE